MPCRAIMFVAAALSLMMSPALAQNFSEPIAFHFYGAEDCGACMVFKRDGLPIVEAAAQDDGYSVSSNIIERTRDVPNIGAFGATDAILRRATPELDRVYPPIFFVSRGEEVISVHGHDWRAAMKAAGEAASVN